MIKTSIGELKLFPIKEEGKFVFYNDFITINGKVSKGDQVKIFVESYEIKDGKHLIKSANPATALLTVRGKEHRHTDEKAHKTIEQYYDDVTEAYKNHFYFGAKA